MDGRILMEDDRDLIIGEVREAVRSIKEHLRRQDDVAIARDQQTEINKREAIKARMEKEERENQKHESTQEKLRVMDEKATRTFGLALASDLWIKEKGDPLMVWYRDEGGKLGGRVSILEQAKVAEAAEKAQAEKVKARQVGEARGSARTWALIGAIGTVVGGIFTAILTYGRDAIDWMKEIGQ